MKRFFTSVECVILAYASAMSAIALFARHRSIYLGYHALVVAMLVMIAWADRRHGGTFWRVVRHWIALYILLGSFREMHYLIPEVNPFEDHASDLALMELDRRLFGDVHGFVSRLWWPPLVDFLHLCYWTYFPMPLALLAVLWFRKRLPEFRQATTILLAGFYIGYLTYLLVPAVGPHHFEARSPGLDGAWIGGRFHRALLAVEWSMADAFPSLHTTVAAMSLALAWRLQRRLFWIFLVPALGLVAATFVLRYHYLIDVAAGLAVAPIALAVGRWVSDRCESTSP